MIAQASLISKLVVVLSTMETANMRDMVKLKIVKTIKPAFLIIACVGLDQRENASHI